MGFPLLGRGDVDPLCVVKVVQPRADLDGGRVLNGAGGTVLNTVGRSQHSPEISSGAEA